MIIRSGLSHVYWDRAYLYAIYIDNRTWHERLGSTPYENFLRIGPPDLSKLHLFGSWALVKKREVQRRDGGPFADQAVLGRFLSLSKQDSNGFDFLLGDGSIYSSQHAAFLTSSAINVPADQEALLPNSIRLRDSPFGVDFERTLFSPFRGVAEGISGNVMSQVPFGPRSDPVREKGVVSKPKRSKQQKKMDAVAVDNAVDLILHMRQNDLPRGPDDDLIEQMRRLDALNGVPQLLYEKEKNGNGENSDNFAIQRDKSVKKVQAGVNFDPSLAIIGGVEELSAAVSQSSPSARDCVPRDSSVRVSAPVEVNSPVQVGAQVEGVSSVQDVAQDGAQVAASDAIQVDVIPSDGGKQSKQRTRKRKKKKASSRPVSAKPGKSASDKKLIRNVARRKGNPASVSSDSEREEFVQSKVPKSRGGYIPPKRHPNTTRFSTRKRRAARRAYLVHRQERAMKTEKRRLVEALAELDTNLMADGLFDEDGLDAPEGVRYFPEIQQRLYQHIVSEYWQPDDLLLTNAQRQENIFRAMVAVSKPDYVPPELPTDLGVDYLEVPEWLPNEDIPQVHGKVFRAFRTGVYLPEGYDPYTHDVPYKKALVAPDSQEFHKAMQSEIDDLLAKNVYELVDRPNHKRVLKGRWVLSRKYKDKELDRHKARWVVCGYVQREGVDYDDTYAPVAMAKSWKAFFSIVASLRLDTKLIDVRTAFLNASIDKEIFVEQPKGFEDSTNRVCKLKRALYGLKQSPLLWFRELVGFLVDDCHLTQMKNEPCMFVARRKRDSPNGKKDDIELVLLIHSDDLAFGYVNKSKTAHKVIEKVRKRFKIREQDGIDWVLGMGVQRDSNGGVILNQSAFIHKILAEFDSHLKPADTPIDHTRKFSKSMSHEPTTFHDYKDFNYRHVIGNLSYLVLGTRPDLAFAYHLLSRFAQDPQPAHIKAVTQVIRYLKKTKDFAMKFQGGAELKLEMFVDADYGNDLDTRRSHTGWIAMLGGTPVSWKTTLQKQVSLSTTEAEIMAAVEGIKEAVWWRNLLQELGFEQREPTVVHEDNSGAVAIADNSKSPQRIKHNLIRVAFLQENVRNGKVRIVKVDTDNQLADPFTKPLDRQKHWKFLAHMLVDSSGKSRSKCLYCVPFVPKYVA